MTYRTKYVDMDCNANTQHELGCIVCGKPTKGRYWLHMVEGGTRCVHPDDEEAYAKADDRGDLGAYPLGPNCMKKQGLKEWAHDEGKKS